MSQSNLEPAGLALDSNVTSENKTQSVVVLNRSKPRTLRRPNKDERKGFQVLRFRVHIQQRKQVTTPHGAQGTRESSTISLRPFKGNTDPFSVAAVAITPATHELLSLCHHMVLFRDYPLWAASMYERRVKDSQALAIQNALGDAAMLHCLLASGYYIRSQPNDTNQINALKHKTHVLESVRMRLASSQDVELQINYLMLFDSLVGDYEACEVHWHGLKSLVARTHSRHRTITLRNLQVRDVWLAHYQNRKTFLDVNSWDRPATALSRAHETRDQNRVDCQVDPFLIEMMRDIRELKSLQRVALELPGSEERDELVDWLYLHNAANDGRLINYLVQLQTEFHSSSEQALNAALTLCIMCFLALPYTYQHYSFSQSIRQRRLEPLLLQASLHIENDLLVWLYFMCAINDTLLPSPTNRPLGVFLNLRTSHGDWLETRAVLEKFLYLEGMENRLVGGPTHLAAQPDSIHHLFSFRRRVSELLG